MKIVSSKPLDFNHWLIIIIALRQSLCDNAFFRDDHTTQNKQTKKKIQIPFLNLMVLFAPSLLFNDSFPPKSAEKTNNNADMSYPRRNDICNQINLTSLKCTTVK